MADRHHHLAQANVGRIVAPLDDPAMAGFVEQLDYINSVADRSPGFVWRLQTPEGDATAIRPFEDESLLVNMSVWEDLDSLYEYTYRSDHLAPLRERRKWFQRMDSAHLVLWWVPVGHRPTVDEAKQRLELLDREGAGPHAFTFKQPYDADGKPIERKGARDWAFGGI